MERLEIQAKSRSNIGKGAARKIRASGGIPAILYGKGAETVPLEIEAHAFNRAVAGMESINALINLSIDGEQSVPVVLREHQAHVLTRDFLHLDFHKVDLSKKIKLEVPIHVVGIAKGVKEEGGILEHSLRQLEISCLPDKIPAFIEVDVSVLASGDNLHVADLKLPEGIEALTPGNTTVATVVEPASAEPSPVVASESEEEGKAEAKEAKSEEKK
ncbi:MAG: 50S ribosomal protein L25 [Deltaproteobacteria bacterium]|nr:50S ribosomal protein L25 [Deltaproteobacteria bacterium]